MDWKAVYRKGKRTIIPILQHILATRSSVAACLVVLYVVKLVALVSFFLSNTLSVIYLITDIGDFLKQEIRGPAKFSCKSGKECKFEEPAMNDLINSIFGDTYITLQCQGGECLHYSQVPGYVVSRSFLQQFLSSYLPQETAQAQQHTLACTQLFWRYFFRGFIIRRLVDIQELVYIAADFVLLQSSGMPDVLEKETILEKFAFLKWKQRN